MEKVLWSWVYSCLADPITIDAVDIAEEYCNERHLRLSSEEVARSSESQVSEFANHLIGLYNQSLLKMGAIQGQITIYWWFDEMGGCSLCHSFVSTSHGKLPFGCKVVPAASLSEIVGSFMRSTLHDGIPMSEFTEIGFVDANEIEDDEEEHECAVWSHEIPPLSAA